MKLRILAIVIIISTLSSITRPAAINACQGNVENKRSQTFYNLSSRLNLLSDKQLQELLAQGTQHFSNWGQTSQIEIDGIPVFVKSIPLTDLERKPENMRSTRNLFGLPQVYQYGVGSAGFGAWRELDAHIMTTNWVLSGKCPNFPLLYHWRVLPSPDPKPMNDEEFERLEHITGLWENNPEIRAQLEARHNASARIVLFMEYFPEELFRWLLNEFTKGDDAAETAVKMVFANIEALTKCMRQHDFAHLDFHLRNMLTDGKQIYLIDFGSVSSSAFDLSDTERAFLKLHDYDDLYRGITVLVEIIIRERVDKSITNHEENIKVLKEFANGRRDESLPPFFQDFLTRYAPLALIYSEFMDKLWNSKSTPYPASELKHAYQKGSK